MAERRGSFGPTVLAGLAGAALAAVAAGRTWATATGDAAGVAVEASVKGSSSAPLVLALALVALAAWGALLVLRARARRVVAVLGALAAAGTLAAGLAAYPRLHDDAAAAATARGATPGSTDPSLGAWYVVTLVGALLTLAAFTAAVRLAPRWPAMGSRYDAPGATRAPVTDQDLWRSLDAGDDPTEDRADHQADPGDRAT